MAAMHVGSSYGRCLEACMDIDRLFKAREMPSWCVTTVREHQPHVSQARVSGSGLELMQGWCEDVCRLMRALLVREHARYTSEAVWARSCRGRYSGVVCDLGGRPHRSNVPCPTRDPARDRQTGGVQLSLAPSSENDDVLELAEAALILTYEEHHLTVKTECKRLSRPSAVYARKFR
jgi:hypothetical protein